MSEKGTKLDYKCDDTGTQRAQARSLTRFKFETYFTGQSSELDNQKRTLREL